MLEISELKAKKLPELQEIAKNLNVPKFRTLKKLDLVYNYKTEEDIMEEFLQLKRNYVQLQKSFENISKKNM